MTSTYILHGRSFPKRAPIRPTPHQVWLDRMSPYDDLPCTTFPSSSMSPLPYVSGHAISLSDSARLLTSPRRRVMSAVEFEDMVNRVSRPTTASRIRSARTRREVLDIDKIGDYSWSVSGLARYNDTAKCMYNPVGTVRRLPLRGNYHHAR